MEEINQKNDIDTRFSVPTVLVVLRDPLTRIEEQVAQKLAIPSLDYLKISKNTCHGDLWLSPQVSFEKNVVVDQQLIDYVKTDRIPYQIFLNRSFVINWLLPDIMQGDNRILPWSSCLQIRPDHSWVRLVCVVQENFCGFSSQLRSLLQASCAQSILLQAGVSVEFFIYMVPTDTCVPTTSHPPLYHTVLHRLAQDILQRATAVYRQVSPPRFLFSLEKNEEDSNVVCYDAERQVFRLSLLSKYLLPSWCYPLQDWYVPLGSYRYRVFCSLYHFLVHHPPDDDGGRGCLLLLFTDPPQSHTMHKCMQAAVASLYDVNSRDDPTQTISPRVLLEKVKWIHCGQVVTTSVHPEADDDPNSPFLSAHVISSLWGGKATHPTRLDCLHPVEKWLYQYARIATLRQKILVHCSSCPLPTTNDYQLDPIEWNIFYTNVATYYRILPSLCQDLMDTRYPNARFHLLTEWLAKTTSNFTQLYSQLRIVIKVRYLCMYYIGIYLSTCMLLA